ncbi:MAG: hypothetical protein ACKO9Q_10260 [Pirellula sp.]
MRYFTILAGLLLTTALLGCGDGLIPIKTAPVDGVVKFDGKAPENYRIYFYCEQAAAKESSSALIASDGTFRVTTRVQGDGAIVGLNQIWFSWDPPVPPSDSEEWNPPTPTLKIPEKYLSRESSGLSVEVTNSGLKDYSIDLK